MKNIIYIRTSTEDQNPENQLKDCLSTYKEEWGDYEVIEDKQSAWKEHIERDGFNRIRKLIINKGVRHLVIWDLDRIYRNRKNLIDFFKLCELSKCKIHSYRQKWLEQVNEMPSPWDEIIHDLMIQIMGWLAQDESDKKSQRVRSAIRIKEDGAYSYKGNKWGRKELSTQSINKILELHKNGLSIREISRQVNYSDKNNNLKPVSKSAVHKVISGNHRKTKLVKKDSPQLDNQGQSEAI